MRRIIGLIYVAKAKFYAKALEKVTRKLENADPNDLIMNNYYLRLFMDYSEKSLKYSNLVLG